MLQSRPDRVKYKHEMRPHGLLLQEIFVLRCDRKVRFRDFQAVEWPARGPGTNAHRDIRTGRPASYRTVRVTPPKIHSLKWEWP